MPQWGLQQTRASQRHEALGLSHPCTDSNHPAEATKGHPQSLGLSTSEAPAAQKQGPCFSPPYSHQPWTAWNRLL